MTVQPVDVYTPYQPTIAKNKQIKKKIQITENKIWTNKNK